MVFQELVWSLDESNHEEFLRNDFTVINFLSEWQMDCLMYLPIIESLAAEFEGKIFFGKVDVEESKEIAEKHSVRKVPSILIFRNGKVIDRIDNFDSEDSLRDRICLLI